MSIRRRSTVQTENRKCRGDLLELRKCCIFVHGHVRSRSRCSLQVSPQDRCALVGGHLFELDLLTGAAPENRSSTGCTYVVDPLHVISEHRHQVPLSIDDCHHQRQRDGAPRLSSGHFQCHEVVGRHARRGHSSRRSVQNLRDPVGSLPTVQPSSEVAYGHVSCSTIYDLVCFWTRTLSGGAKRPPLQRVVGRPLTQASFQ